MGMKQALVSALVAAVVSFAVWQIASRGAAEPAASAPAAPKFTVTDELFEDAWVDGARAPGAEHKPLAAAANSICYLTKVEIKGVQSPEDANSCSIGIDDFTGFWQVTAAVAEGGKSHARCNARCLVWE
jgi:hypothetical protein